MKPLLRLAGGQYFFKKIYFCYRKLSSSTFLDTHSNGRVFRFSEIIFFNESFILASQNGFSINYKPRAFIESYLYGKECKAPLKFLTVK